MPQPSFDLAWEPLSVGGVKCKRGSKKSDGGPVEDYGYISYLCHVQISHLMCFLYTYLRTRCVVVALEKKLKAAQELSENFEVIAPILCRNLFTSQ